jgi:predicted RNA-binding Zn-ribbon protein involved in translation (DUF1610 family)
MLYCYHCGEEIDEHKIEAEGSSYEKAQGQEIDENTSVSYVCPRCGHLIHKGASEADLKSLSAASHAEIQRGRNSFAQGMGFTSLGVISLILCYVFFLLAHKATQQNALIRTCPEYFVFLVLLVVGSLLFGAGLTLDLLGACKIRRYQNLLSEIQKKTFFQ